MRDNRMTWWFWVPVLPKPLIIGAWALFILLSCPIPYLYYWFNPGQPPLITLVQGLGGNAIGVFTWSIIAIQLNAEVITMVLVRRANQHAVEVAAEKAREQALAEGREQALAESREQALAEGREQALTEVEERIAEAVARVRAEAEERIAAAEARVRAEAAERAREQALAEAVRRMEAAADRIAAAGQRASAEAGHQELLAWYEQVKGQLPAGTPPPPGLNGNHGEKDNGAAP